MPGKTTMRSISSPQEPKSQSKVNPALSYGKATGKTYINKGTASKNKGAGPKRTNSNKAIKTLIDMLLPGTPRSVKANTMRQFEAARNSLKAPVKRGR